MGVQAVLVSILADEAGTYGTPWATACGDRGANTWDGFGCWLRELEKSWCVTDSVLQLFTPLKP